MPIPLPRAARRPRAASAVLLALLLAVPLALMAPAPAGAATASTEKVAFFDAFESGALDPEKWASPGSWGTDRARVRPWETPDLPVNDTLARYLTDSPWPSPGRYGNATRTRVETNWFDLTEASAAAQLTITHRYDIDPLEDGAIVLARSENLDWAVVRPIPAYPTANGFSGYVSAFEPATFDLTIYSGSRIKIAFQILSGDNGHTGDGWQIDAVRVSYTATVPQPDLAMTEVQVFNSAGGRIQTGTAGDVLELAANVTNLGNAATTAPVPVFFYDGTPSAGRLLGEAAVPTVRPGESTSVRIKAVLVAGDHNISAVIDPGRAIRELSVADNEGKASVRLDPPGGVDLALLDARFEVDGVRSSGARPAQSVVANLTIGNLGQQSLSGSFSLGVYLLSGGNATSITEVTRIGLFAGEIKIVQLGFLAIPGNLTLLCAVDISGSVSEAAKANNNITRPFTVSDSPPVDLVIDSVTVVWRGAPIDGATENELLTLKGVVRNGGSGAVTDSFQVAAFLGDPDAGGALLFLRTVSAGLASNGTLELQGTWASVIGQRTIYFVADVGRTIFERDEFNNKAGKALTVSSDTRPDLIIDAVRFKVQGVEVDATRDGAHVSVEVSVRNAGANGTTAGTLSLTTQNPWVSQPVNPPTAPLPSPLARNSVAVLVFNWSARPGSHVFYLVVNVGLTVHESDPLNNFAIRTLVVSPDSPDLVVGSVSVKSQGVETGTLYKGLNVTISADVSNDGVAAVGEAFEVDIWAGDPGTLEAERIKQVVIDGPFPPGEVVKVFATWLAFFPSGGATKIVVIADPVGNLIEADRANNRALKEVTFASTRLPNLVVDTFSAFWLGSQVVQVKEGASVTLALTVANKSPAPFLGGAIVQIKDGERVIWSAAVPRVEPGGFVSYEANWTAQPGASLSAVIDPMGTAPESDESDNVQALPVTVAAAPRMPVTLYAGAAGAGAAGVLGVLVVRQRRRRATEKVTEADIQVPGAVTVEAPAGGLTGESRTVSGELPAAEPASAAEVIAAPPPAARGPAPASAASAGAAMAAETASADAEAGEMPSAEITGPRCASCGAAVESGWAQCPKCGASLALEPPAIPANCPKCGEPTEPGWVICPTCETPLR